MHLLTRDIIIAPSIVATTVQELYELNNLFDLHLNGTCVFDRKGNYWSQGEEGEGMAGAWEMSEQCDPARRYFTKNAGNVRAVRP